MSNTERKPRRIFGLLPSPKCTLGAFRRLLSLSYRTVRGVASRARASTCSCRRYFFIPFFKIFFGVSMATGRRRRRRRALLVSFTGRKKNGFGKYTRRCASARTGLRAASKTTSLRCAWVWKKIIIFRLLSNRQQLCPVHRYGRTINTNQNTDWVVRPFISTVRFDISASILNIVSKKLFFILQKQLAREKNEKNNKHCSGVYIISCKPTINNRFDRGIFTPHCPSHHSLTIKANRFRRNKYRT